MILRVYGDASVIHPRDDAWDGLSALFPPLCGARQILDLSVNFVLTSCGFAVPLYEYIGQRDTLERWTARNGVEGVRMIWEEYTQVSIDGKPTNLLDDRD